MKGTRRKFLARGYGCNPSWPARWGRLLLIAGVLVAVVVWCCVRGVR